VGLPKTCVCDANYFDTGDLVTGNVICSGCDITCGTCENLSNVCTSCIAADFRYLLGTSCVCNNGFFNPTVPSKACLPCNYTCQTCNGPTSADVKL
jgi:hypothetical protein